MIVHAYEEWGEGFLSRISRHVRAGAVGRPDAHAPRGPRSGRREAALLRQDAAGAAARLRDQGAAVAAGGRPDARPRGARPVPDLRVHDRAAHDLRRRSGSCRRRITSLYRDGEVAVQRYWDAADVAVRAVVRRRRGRGAARNAGPGRAQPDDGGRAAGGVPVGRHRLERGRGSCCETRRAHPTSRASAWGSTMAATTSCRSRARSRRCAVRRHYEGHGHAGRRVTVRQADRPPRRAIRGRVAVPDVPGLADGTRTREGRADRRRRRRAVRRLRRLRGRSAGGQAGRSLLPDGAVRAADAVLGLVPPTTEEERAGQQGAAVRRRPGACAEVDRALPLDDVSLSRRRSGGCIPPAFRDGLLSSDVYAPVRDALAATGGDDC